MSTPYDRNIQAIVIHHPGDGKPPEETILNRWNPYGYQYPEYDFGIEADGTIRIGRPLNIIGAHCQSDIPPFSERGDNWWNKNSIGIGLAGDFTKYAMSWAQYEALVKLVRKLMAKYNVTEIRAHKEVARTACPGNWDFESFKKDLEGINVDKAILIFSIDDLPTARRLQGKIGNCAVFFRNADTTAPADVKAAKHLFVVGGSSVGHPNETVLAGSDWFATAAAVKNYIG